MSVRIMLQILKGRILKGLNGQVLKGLHSSGCSPGFPSPEKTELRPWFISVRPRSRSGLELKATVLCCYSATRPNNMYLHAKLLQLRL